jgi:hypothetical protein
VNEAENEAWPEVKEGTTRYPTRARNKPSYLSEYVVESVIDNSISHAVDTVGKRRSKLRHENYQLFATSGPRYLLRRLMPNIFIRGPEVPRAIFPALYAIRT